MTLPDGFLWGAATAAHQIEGNNTNSDFWAREGLMGGSHGELSGDACDSYHRYAEDIGLLADAGLTCYRFSFEWARIEPRDGHFSRAELLHYRRMIDACLERGVTPVITLNHFTLPAWFAREGGWRRPDAAERFAAYVAFCCDILTDVDWIVTINEPNMLGLMEMMSDKHAAQFAAAQQGGQEPSAGEPSTADAASAIETIGMAALGLPTEDFARRIGAAHRAAVEVIRERTSAQVGWAIAVQSFVAADDSPDTADQVATLNRFWEDVYFTSCTGDDFVGVQSYGVKEVGPQGPLPTPEHPDNTQTGMAFRPDALGVALRRALDQTGLPLFVTENGIATSDDEQRVAYIDGAVAALKEVVADGATVRGYCHWSLLDNYEWGSWRPTFGLIAVDREDDFARSPKPSLAHLGDLARSNAAALTA